MNIAQSKEIAFQNRTEQQVRTSFSGLKTRYRKVEFHSTLSNGLISGEFTVTPYINKYRTKKK